MILKVISNYKMTLFENGIQISTKRWMESLVDMNWSSTQWQCFDFDLYFFLGCLKFVFAFHQRKSGLYPHEEKSCSCKSNIFYLTYLAVSCTYSARWMVHLRWAWSFGCKRSRLLAGPFHEFRSLCMNLLWNPILFIISERSAYCVTSAWQFLHFVCCFAWTFRYWKANSLN